MKLREYNAVNCSATMTLTHLPVIGISLKGGLFRFKKEVCKLLGLSEGDRVTFHQDEETAEWYIEKVKDKGFELKVNKAVCGGLIFNNTRIAKCIASSIEYEGSGGNLLVGSEPVKEGNHKLHHVSTELLVKG
jgi:hypothetical protein